MTAKTSAEEEKPPMKMEVIQWQGKPISQAGIYAGIPIDDYHGAEICVGPAVSSSGLRTILKDSPAHYWADSPYNATRTEDEEKKRAENAAKESLVLGRAAHHMLLGEADFKKTFVCRPERYPDWKTAESRSWRVSVELPRVKGGPGLTVLTPAQLNQIRGMAMALVKAPMLRTKGGGLLTGFIEHSFFWKDPATGLWLKARPDAIPIDWQSFADLKTTHEIALHEIARSIFTYRYDVQAAMIRKLAREIMGIDIGDFYFVFVTKKPPYLVQTVTLDTRRLGEAERDIAVALRVFAHSWVNKEWLGPGGSQCDLQGIDFTDWQAGEAKFRREFWEQELRLKQPKGVKR